ncbi:MAG: hypothetical protein ACK5TD_00860 [bacterium]
MTTSMAACSYTNPEDTTTLIVGASTNPAPATKSIQQKQTQKPPPKTAAFARSEPTP